MTKKKIWTVSQLNSSIKELIEDGFFPVWLKGEISNLTIHRSGHVYCTIKDNQSQISIVFFNGANKINTIQLKDGQAVEVFGTLTVYEPRGSYQLNISQIRLVGIGNLQKKFDELKLKLFQEGLFSQKFKKKIPSFPQKIGIITSPQGAAIHDFLNIIQRRFDSLEILIYPTPVQGIGAAAKMAHAIEWFNTQNNFDIIILTRGGGSLEDLWEFNEEFLARAISKSNLPIISAVGHEIDFTISDLVADLRVPTPSAAAEIVIDKKINYINTINHYKNRMENIFSTYFKQTKMHLKLYHNRLEINNPIHKLQTQQQKIDEISQRLNFVFSTLINYQQQKLLRLKNFFSKYSPQPLWQEKNQYLQELNNHFHTLLQNIFSEKKQKLTLLKQKLLLINPKNILKRGYAIVEDINNNIIYNPQDIKSGQKLAITLANGKINVTKD